MSDMVRFMFDHSVALNDAGVQAGMNAARQGGRQEEYEAHKRLFNGVYGVNPISRAYSEGFIIGYNAIISGVMF